MRNVSTNMCFTSKNSLKLNEICCKISNHQEDKLTLVLLKSTINFFALHKLGSVNYLTIAPRCFLFVKEDNIDVREKGGARELIKVICSIIFTFVLSPKHLQHFLNILNRYS